MQKIDLSILPQGGINPVVRCSQGDVGRQFQIELYNEDCTAKYVLDGTEELSFEGIKPDGNIFQYDITPQSGSTVTISTTEQMTAVYGDVICELRILEAGGGSILGTANITLCVEIGPSSHDIVSASAIMLVDEVRGYMEDARQYSEDSKAWAVGPNGSGSGTDTNNSKYYSGQSANSATASANSADDSKAWAVGPNGSGTGTDSNNSKFYSQQSASSASSASSSASDAKAWAVGPSGTGSGTDSNNAKYYANQSATSASDASDYKDAAVGAASASASSATDSKAWAVGPSGTGTGTDSNNAKYYSQQSAQSATDADNAKDDAVSAKNAAESAQQKIENMTASASGLPAGSSPTVTKTEVGGVVNLGFGIPKGDKGDTGNDGVSPTASVTQTDPDTVTFTVTDRQGTTTATLSAGGAPALSGLSDVNLTTPSDGQALVYDNNSSKWVNGKVGGANESLVDWSQTNACRWRVSRFYDSQYSFGVELELNSELGIYEGVTNVQFGSQLIQDPMHYGNTYQSAIIDIPLNNLVSVYNGQNVDVLVEGNTYTFELYNDFADYSYFPATFSFNPATYEWFDPHDFPPESVLTRDVVVAGCTISRDNGIVYVRIGLWVRTAQKITTFADLCTALGLSSWGGAFGHFAGVIVLSKSKS